MNDRLEDERLRRLLSDAVCEIEPTDRLEVLRARVHPSPRVVPMSRSRSWYAATGIIATAAVIGIVAYVTSVAGNQNDTVGPATDSGTALPSATIATDTAAPQPSRTTAPKGTAVPVFYLGHGPRGDVLFHEATPVPIGVRALDTALAGLMTDPLDPDYHAPWKPGWLISAALRDGVIHVEVGAPARRPASMPARTAYETVQSAVYSFQAATHSHAAVLFERSGRTAPTVLGVPTSQPVSAARVTDVLSLVNITAPDPDGARYHRGRLVISGTNNGFEATVSVRLVRHDPSGDTTVLSRPGMASGTGDPDRLYPWKVVLDTSGLAPGRYLVVAQNDDPSGRGNPPTDTRIIVLR
jgi:hypothetical protein